MSSWVRLTGACFPAAAVTSFIGGALFFLGLIVWGVATGHDGTLAGSVGPTAPGSAYTGFFIWAAICGVLSFPPALGSAVGALLPLHLVLARNGRMHPAWYAAAGGDGAMLATVALRYFFGYWASVFEAGEFDGMLAVAALGGPLGGLVYRQIVTS